MPLGTMAPMHRGSRDIDVLAPGRAIKSGTNQEFGLLVMRGNALKLCQERFRLDIRRNFLTENTGGAAREVAESPCDQSKLGLDDLRGLFIPKRFCENQKLPLVFNSFSPLEMFLPKSNPEEPARSTKTPGAPLGDPTLAAALLGQVKG